MKQTTVPISSIIVGPRARQVDTESNEFNALKHSISSTGVLIHPPTVILLSTGKYQLVSGARRLRAVKELGWIETPVTIIPPVGSSTLLLLELDENRRREQFKWQEEVDLKCRVFEKMKETKPQLKQTWFAEDVLGEHKSMFTLEYDLYKGRRDLISQGREADASTLWLIESITKAREFLRQLQLTEVLKEKHRREDVENRISPALNQEPNSLGVTTDLDFGVSGSQAKVLRDGYPLSWRIEDDALGLLQSLDDSSIDCCVTDPPFGISIQEVKHRSNGAPVYENEDSPEYYQVLMTKVLQELSRVLVPGGHLYIFFSMTNYRLMTSLCLDTGLDFWPHPLIWVKYNLNGTGSPGSCQAPDYLPAMTYHPILFCWSNRGPRRALVQKGQPNVIIYPPLPPETKDHPLSFPCAVYSNLMTRSCHPSDTVIDPFCGSGNSIEAGLLQGYYMLGAEKVERYRVLAEEKAREIWKMLGGEK